MVASQSRCVNNCCITTSKTTTKKFLVFPSALFHSLFSQNSITRYWYTKTLKCRKMHFLQIFELEGTILMRFCHNVESWMNYYYKTVCMLHTALLISLQTSGLSDWIGQQLTILEVLPEPVLIIVLGILVTIITQFTSNVASASLLMPIASTMVRNLPFSSA